MSFLGGLVLHSHCLLLSSSNSIFWHNVSQVCNLSIQTAQYSIIMLQYDSKMWIDKNLWDSMSRCMSPLSAGRLQVHCTIRMVWKWFTLMIDCQLNSTTCDFSTARRQKSAEILNFRLKRDSLFNVMILSRVRGLSCKLNNQLMCRTTSETEGEVGAVKHV